MIPGADSCLNWILDAHFKGVSVSLGNHGNPQGRWGAVQTSQPQRAFGCEVVF